MFIGVAATIGVGAVIWVLGSSDHSAAARETAAATAPVKDLGWGNARVQRVAEWANAVRTQSTATLASTTDMSAMQVRLGVAPDRPVLQATGSSKRELEAMIVATLARNDTAAVFRDFAPADGRLDDAAMATREHGSVLMRMPARPDSPYAQLAADAREPADDARVRVSFRMQGEALKVTGWEIVHLPPKPAAAASPPPAATIPAPMPAPASTPAPAQLAATPPPPPAEVVAAPVATRIVPGPLGHLPDTTPEQQREIDALIVELTDLSASPKVYNRACNALAKIGRPAVPRLLNRMYEALPKKQAESVAVRRIVQALQQMTGERFGYNVESRDASGVGATDEERRAALEQWYAWWDQNRDRDVATANRAGRDDSLLETEAEKDAPRSRAPTPPAAGNTKK